MSQQPWRVCRFSLPRAALVVPALIAALLAGCSKPPPPPEPVRSVKLLTVATGAYGSDVEYAGEVRPRVESRLGFRVAGKIVRRQVELGQTVRVGQVLAELDARDLRLAADAARAQVAAATTNRDLAQADLKRYQELRAQSFISGAELERRDASYKAAQAQLDQAQAQLAAQGNQAGYARLVADVAGVVTGIEAEPGQVVSAGQPVVRVAQSGVRDVVFAVPEDRVDAVEVGSAVQVRPWNSDTEIPGRIREVAASADAATRTFQVKVALETKTPPPLGTTVSVVPRSLGHVGTPVIKLPSSALKRDSAGVTAVWVLDAATMTVKSVPVQVASADGNEVVIASGLQPGMQVVAAGVHVLSPGQKVTIYKPRVGAAGQAEPQAAAASASASASASATR
jgi:multidrug efflux system membrane fusion protein